MTSDTAKRVSGFLGLCTRAGKLVSGQEACVDAVRRHSVAVVLLDEEASDNTRKRVSDACKTHGVLLYGMEEDMIADSTGKEGRKVVAVQNGGMAKKMLALLQGEPVLSGSALPGKADSYTD